MQARAVGILAGGLVAAVALFIILHDIYLAGIAVVIVLALAMAFQIMGETKSLPPRLACWLSEDARKVLIKNHGNEPAVTIHLTLVPLGLQFDLPELSAEGRHEVPLPSMISEAKAVVTWEDPSGRKFSGSYPLSATGRSDDDLLKPMFPTFGWK